VAAKKAKTAKLAKTLEQTLWDAADKMRGNLEAGEYKHVVHGFVFVRYVSEAFQDRQECLQAAIADPITKGYLPIGNRSFVAGDRNDHSSREVHWFPAEVL
jgi:type I restriction enzyme M protein